MPNLKKINGIYKNIIGQCMFKATRKYACLTRHWNKGKFIDFFGRFLNNAQIDFLLKDWFNLDCVEILSNGPAIFDIVTRSNQSNQGIISSNLLSQKKALLYKDAIELGFKVYLTTIILEESWDFSVTIKRYKAT